MAYIGKTPITGNFVKLDAISVVNGQAGYTMNNGGSAFTDYENVNQFLVSLNGILQAPTDSFTVSGSTLTFASNLATGDVIDFVIVLGNTLDIGTPSDNTVTAAKIGANAVTSAKLNNDIISGATELASEPADTDEFLVSDAGTIKRIDYSLIKGGGITEADQWRITADHTPGSSAAIISSNWERTDTDGFNKIGTGMTESSGIFTFPSTGFYLVELNFWFSQLASDYVVGYIYTTTDNSSYGEAATAVGSGGNTSKNNSGSTKFLFDVTDTSTHKVAFYALKPATYGLIKGNTATNQSSVTFIRLGDT